jgi:hypothetical protein
MNNTLTVKEREIALKDIKTLLAITNTNIESLKAELNEATCQDDIKIIHSMITNHVNEYMFLQQREKELLEESKEEKETDNMSTETKLVVLTDGKRTLHIDGEALLNFLEVDDHVTIDNVMEYMKDTTEEELTDIFNYCIVQDKEKGFMILGYYIDSRIAKEEITPATIFVAIDEGHYNNLTYYAPIGQHSEGDRAYIEECTPITKERYLEISKSLYTPKAYL